MTNPLDTQVGGDHYKRLKIQPVEYITQNGLGFLEGCVVKRITRWRSKDGIQDLEKIKHEVDLLIEMHRREQAEKELDVYSQASRIKAEADRKAVDNLIDKETQTRAIETGWLGPGSEQAKQAPTCDCSYPLRRAHAMWCASLQRAQPAREIPCERAKRELSPLEPTCGDCKYLERGYDEVPCADCKRNRHAEAPALDNWAPRI